MVPSWFLDGKKSTCFKQCNTDITKICPTQKLLKFLSIFTRDPMINSLLYFKNEMW